MPSPFPGIHPYIEHSSVWSDFHNDLASMTCNSIIGPNRHLLNFLNKKRARWLNFYLHSAAAKFTIPTINACAIAFSCTAPADNLKVVTVICPSP